MNNSYIELNNQEEEKIDYKKTIFLLRRQWKWLLLFCALGIIGAMAYLKLTKPSYIISTTILIPENSNGLDMEDLFQGAIQKPKNNIYNQIEIIRSYYTINKTLANLNWRTSWYMKELFIWKGIYKQEPFDVQEGPNFVNPGGIPIYIKPTSGNFYDLTINGTITENNVPVDIKIKATGEYGRPYIDKHFNFTLLKKVNSETNPESKYYFKFNDLNDATLAYMEKLDAVLKDKKSDIIQCTIIGEEPNKESEFLNELINVYTTGKMDFQNESQRRSLDFINNQLAGIADSLSTTGDKFTEFRSKNSVIDLGAEGTMVMNNLKEVETEGAKSQMQLEYFENLLNYLNNKSDLKQLLSPSVVGIEDVALNSLVIKLGELYNRRQVISFSAKENNPTLVLIDKELKQTRNQLIENLGNLIDNAKRNIASQKERQNKISVQLNRLPQKEQQMVNIQRQFNLTSEIYTFLLQKRAETNIALASSIPDIQVIDEARPQTASKVGLSNSMILIAGFLIGIGLPVCYIIIINYFDDKIRTQKDLEKNTNLPILGNIIHSISKTDLVVSENPKSTIAESFRAVRTNLQYMLNGTQGNIISINSTNPGEGKSFSAINLATILAMNNKIVLLIGADMRKPRLHKVFNQSNEAGLSTYLIGLNSLNEIILKTQIENLFILPSGPIPPNPSEILSKPEFKTLLDDIKSKFDYIVIDNAPTALVTDAQIISHLADLNVFILRYAVSHKNEIEMINQYVSQGTMSKVAIIVNDIKTNSFGYSYYKYYQYETYQKAYYSDEGYDIKKNHKKKEPKLNEEKIRV